MLAKRGETTPPTKLQTFFFGVRIARVRIEPKHHIDVIPGHFHPLDQRPDEVPLARPVGGLQTVVAFGCNVLQTANHQRQFPLQSGLIRHRLALLLQPGEAWAHAGHPGLTCGLVHEAIRITVDQACDALAPLAYLVFDGGQRRACGARLWLQAAALFLRAPLRVGQHRPDCLPDRHVPQIRAPRRVLTETRTPKAVRVRAQTAVRGVRTRLALAGARAEAFPRPGRATVLAWEHALQPIQGPAVRLPGLVLVLLPLRLDRRAHRGLHEGRDRDRAPLLGRDITDGPGPAGLHGATALRPQPGPQGLLARLAKRRGTGRGRGLHEAPPDTPIPDRLAGAGHLARLGAPPPDLAHRQAVASDPGTDVTDHTGCVRDPLLAGLAAPCVRGHRAGPVRCPAPHMPRPNTRGMPRAAPVPFDALGTFILRAHALHLQAQGLFRAVPPGALQDDDLAPGTSALIDPQDLVGVLPGQALWRMARASVHPAGGEHIAPALQRRADQRGATLSCIATRHGLGHGAAIGRDALLPRRHLTRDGVRLGGLFRRHAGVDRHLGWMHANGLLPPCCVCRASSSGRGGSAWGVGRRVLGTTRAYACTIQAGRTRLGSNERRTARVVVRVRIRRATTASSRL